VAIIAINIVAFLADWATGHFETALATVPGYGLREVHHFVGGFSDSYSMIPAHVVNNLAAAWPTVFTSMFLHANLLHVGGNMLMMWIFGNNIEDVLGRFRFLVFYLVCGCAAAAAQVLSSPDSRIPTIGASGAVAGVMGAYLVLFPRAQVRTLIFVLIFATVVDLPAIIVIGLWAAAQFANAGLLGGGEMRGGGIAYFAHVGGLVAGIAIILLLGGRALIDRRDAYIRDDGYEY
jgi:membrane associated rhomboid family serine protease